MNKYSELLKRLFNFSRLKMIILSNELGYNTSYISKWQNGTKLPSKKNIHTINEVAARLFAEEIFNNNRVPSFFMEFNIHLPDNNRRFVDSPKYLTDCINQLLNDTYNEVVGDTIKKDDEISHVAVGNSEVRILLHDIFITENLNKNNFSEILTSLPLASPSTEYFMSLFDKAKNINLKIGINITELQENLYKKFSKLYKLLLKHPRIDLEIYSNNEFKDLNLIVAKDLFTINYSMDGNSLLQMISHSNNSTNTQKAYKLMKKNFIEDNIIFQLSSNKLLNTSRYRADFYSDNNFNLLLAYGFEFLLPPVVIEKIAQKAYEETGDITDMLSIQKLQIAWEENFQTKKISFLVFRSNLLKYIEDGKLVYMDTRYSLSMEERLMQVDYAFKLMEQNPNIEFYIIDDSRLKNKIDNISIAVFSSKNKLFLKNYIKIFEKRDSAMSICTDDRIINLTNKTLEELKKSEYCKKYSVDELRETWKKYENMFVRIMKIDNSDK